MGGGILGLGLINWSLEMSGFKEATRGIFTLSILAFFFIGWILNLVAIFTSNAIDGECELALRVIGVFIAPLGGILGWF